MKNLKEENGIALKKIIIIVAIIIVGIIIISLNSKPGYEMDIKNGEAVAYNKLRLAITTSRVDGTGTMSAEDFSILGKMVKNADNNNQWFANNSGVFYGNIADTSEYEVTWVSDGIYCAIFYAVEENFIFYLTSYSFSGDDVKGYTFLVEE